MGTLRRIPPVRPSRSGDNPSVVSDRSHAYEKPLGRILLEAGAIGPDALDAALMFQRKSFLPLGRILRDEFGVTDLQLAAALRNQKYHSRIYLRFFPVRQEVQGLLSKEFSTQHEALAFEQLSDFLCVAVSNPTRKSLPKALKDATGQRIKLFIAPWEDIQRKLAHG